MGLHRHSGSDGPPDSLVQLEWIASLERPLERMLTTVCFVDVATRSTPPSRPSEGGSVVLAYADVVGHCLNSDRTSAFARFLQVISAKGRSVIRS